MKNKQNILLLLLASILFANEPYNSSLKFYLDNKNDLKSNKIIQNDNNKLKAMLSSAIIPGAGQYFINKQKKKGILFLGLELIAWVGYFSYKNKAQSYKQDYQSYGDNHWGLSTWIEHYYDWSDPNNEFFEIFANNESMSYPDINEGSHHIDFSYIDDVGDRIFVRTSSDDFFEIYQNWNNDFETENDVIIIKDHHFYENIVKYNHFFAGWDDQDEILMVENSNGYKTAFSPQKTVYRNLYNKSVDNYKIKDNLISFIFINHFVSMVDGLISSNNLSEDFSILYDYNSTINFHEAKLIIKLK